MLQALDASGLAGNTIVVSTSDKDGERFSDEGRTARRRTSRSLDRALARQDRSGIGVRAGHAHDGLGADPGGCRRHRAGRGLSSDGEDPEPILTGRAAPHPRKLYWRFHAGSQRTIRDGNWKYLRIAGNELLFDVVNDPRERANLEDRQRDVFDRLKRVWEAWNATMLPERPRPMRCLNPGSLADRYGITNPLPAAPPAGQPEN